MTNYKETSPQIIGVLYRKLRPGMSFEDFQNAHFPPGKVTKTETGYDVQYFNSPVRVINAVCMDDPTMVISIGLSYGDAEAIFDEVSSKLEIESNRHDKIDKVAEKIGGTKVYLTASDNNYGTIPQNWVPVPLVKMSDKILAKFRSIFLK